MTTFRLQYFALLLPFIPWINFNLGHLTNNIIPAPMLFNDTQETYTTGQVDDTAKG